MLRRRSHLATLLSVALCAVALAGCGESDDEPASGEPGQAQAADQAELTRPELGECVRNPAREGFECGEVEVPWERADESLGTTQIGFAIRERDRAGEPSAGAIFAVEGGPGYPSTGTANSYVNLFRPLLHDRELVLVDMRGTGKSDPINCPGLQRGDQPEWIALSECGRRLGDRAQSYRTSAAADDIDAVRQALGLDEIALYGDSYGTFLAQSYAYRHGETLEALVLDSAYPTFGEDPWYPSLLRLGVRALSITCERDPECTGDPLNRLERLTDFLRQRGRGVGALIDEISEAAYGAPDTYREIDRAGIALLNGNRGPYRRLEHEGVVGYNRVRRYSRASELIVGCNDYPMIWETAASEPERRAQLEQAIRDYPEEKFAPFTPREVALNSEIGYLECLTWPAPNELYEPAVDPETQEPTSAPVLVVSGELDDVTTPVEGRTVADLFADSEHFVARNAGHVDALYYADRAAARRIRAFLQRELR